MAGNADGTRAPLRWLRTVMVMLVSCGAAAAVAAAAPVARAAAPIGSSPCVLRVWAVVELSSGPLNPEYAPNGEVDCGGSTVRTEIQVCSQVENGSNWYTVSGSCATRTATATTNPLAVEEVGVCGHVYRTWDWGDVLSTGATAANHSQAGELCTVPEIATEGAGALAESPLVQPVPGQLPLGPAAPPAPAGLR